jgi:integrase
MEEAARISRELDLPRRQPGSVNSYLNNLAALMNYAENEELILKSPARGLMLPITTRKKDRRNPFSIEQLGRIFGPASPRYRPETPLEDRNGRFWVPLLSLWSGMRLNECCQLMIDDVRYVRKIPIIVIAEDPQGEGDEADAKRVKTEAGERFVPVHPELERLGFLRHWQAMKKVGRRRIFPDLRPGANGYYSDPFSKWFGRYLKGPSVAASAITTATLCETLRSAARWSGHWAAGQVAAALAMITAAALHPSGSMARSRRFDMTGSTCRISICRGQPSHHQRRGNNPIGSELERWDGHCGSEGDRLTGRRGGDGGIGA